MFHSGVLHAVKSVLIGPIYNCKDVKLESS